jgi:hypothetical protein
MKKLLRLFIIANLFLHAHHASAAEPLPLNCPQTLTCHSAPGHPRIAGPFYYSNIECVIDADNELMWKYFKINDNYEPNTMLISKDWVTLSFAGAFIPAPRQTTAALDRPRCLYGIYDPYIPYFVSIMRSVNKKFLPAKNSSWHAIQDQNSQTLLVCDDKTANHCSILIE